MAYTTINNGSLFMNPKIYTGNGSAGNSITGVNFQPDFTWIKDRDNTRNHVLTDAVRGVTKNIFSNTDGTESTDTSTLTAFNSDGFTLGNGTKVNGNSINFASWNWKANGAGSSNTNGSITSTVSVNTTSGFSIVKWSGTAANATIGHGLGSVPKMIIIKNISDAYYWVVYHQATGNTAYTRLNTTDASSSSLNMFQNYTPTDDVFYVSSQGYVNGGGGNQMIAYCFADVQGFSKMGSYVGNGSADGTFVYTGFKPAFVMCKASSVGGSVGYAWSMFDNKRSSYNIERSQLEANTSDAQQTDASGDIDLLSNGFKFRSSASENNQSGATYIYMAFAEAPLVGTNNIPANAR